MLVNLGRIDHREQLTGFHPGADIDIPFPQVTVGAGVDRRVGERLDVPGQYDFLVRRALFRLDHIHNRHGGFIRFLFQSGLSAQPRNDAGDDH